MALAEYLLQVPANRIGYTTMNLGQLKILQEVIALSVFVPFAVLFMKEPLFRFSAPMTFATIRVRWVGTDTRAVVALHRIDHPEGERAE